MRAAEPIRIDVGNTDIGAVRWRGAPGSPVAIALHGITANAWSWSAVARHLDGRMGLVALDARGRGMSRAAIEPYGIRQHADDVAAAIRRLNASPSVVTGHSMGAAVALATAERHPDDVADLVLVDGGPPIDVSADLAANDALDALLGPAIERLQRVWPDRVTYRSMWTDHPAFSDGLTPEIERYVLSDLTECAGGFRSVINEEAVRVDGTDLVLDDELRTLLDRRIDAVTIVRAETGIMATPPPLFDDSVVARYPQHRWRLVPGTNHYTILIGEAGAAAVAEALLTTAHVS